MADSITTGIITADTMSSCIIGFDDSGNFKIGNDSDLGIAEISKLKVMVPEGLRPYLQYTFTFYKYRGECPQNNDTNTLSAYPNTTGWQPLSEIDKAIQEELINQLDWFLYQTSKWLYNKGLWLGDEPKSPNETEETEESEMPPYDVRETTGTLNFALGIFDFVENPFIPSSSSTSGLVWAANGALESTKVYQFYNPYDAEDPTNLDAEQKNALLKNALTLYNFFKQNLKEVNNSYFGYVELRARPYHPSLNIAGNYVSVATKEFTAPFFLRAVNKDNIKIELDIFTKIINTKTAKGPGIKVSWEDSAGGVKNVTKKKYRAVVYNAIARDVPVATAPVDYSNNNKYEAIFLNSELEKNNAVGSNNNSIFNDSDYYFVKIETLASFKNLEYEAISLSSSDDSNMIKEESEETPVFSLLHIERFPSLILNTEKPSSAITIPYTDSENNQTEMFVALEDDINSILNISWDPITYLDGNEFDSEGGNYKISISLETLDAQNNQTINFRTDNAFFKFRIRTDQVKVKDQGEVKIQYKAVIFDQAEQQSTPAWIEGTEDGEKVYEATLLEDLAQKPLKLKIEISAQSKYGDDYSSHSSVVYPEYFLIFNCHGIFIRTIIDQDNIEIKRALAFAKVASNGIYKSRWAFCPKIYYKDKVNVNEQHSKINKAIFEDADFKNLFKISNEQSSSNQEGTVNPDDSSNSSE